VGLAELDLRFTHNLVGGFYKKPGVVVGLIAALSVGVLVG